MSKYCKLVMVADNGNQGNNKFYEMIEENGQIKVTYGRIESSSTTIKKPLRDWDKIIRSKKKKGYKDVTHLVGVEKIDKPTKKKKILSDSHKIGRFFNRMVDYMNNRVDSTYSVKSENVTQAQVDEAQDIIFKLNRCDSKKSKKRFNELLLSLYTTIPRRMARVNDNLLPNISNVGKHLDSEQDNLDAMAAQVIQANKTPEPNESDKEVTILDELAITAKEIKSNKELKYITDQISKPIKGIFRVEKRRHSDVFRKWLKNPFNTNKKTRFLIHGTRCSSVIPILEQGLKIRPSGNFQFSGKVYGDGNYFSEVVSKSLNYTGYDDDKVLLIYEVHVGNPFVYEGWYRGNSFKLSYDELKKQGFDSTYVKAGNGLLNSEIIAYKEEQSRIKYIIWL